MACFEDLMAVIVKYKPQMESIMLANVLSNDKCEDTIIYQTSEQHIEILLPYVLRTPSFRYYIEDKKIRFSLNLIHEQDNEIYNFCRDTLADMGINITDTYIWNYVLPDSVLIFIDKYLKYIINIQQGDEYVND